MQRRVDIYTGLHLARKALDHGKVIHSHKFELNYAGDCLEPHIVEYTAENERTPAGIIGDDFPMCKPARKRLTWFIDMWVRCRKCETCLKAKRLYWAYRALAEWEASGRTWFVTLTYKPDLQYRALCQVQSHGKGSWQTWSPEYQFQKLAGHLSKDVTKYLKRLREPLAKKEWQKVSFRYMLVAESHARKGHNGQIYDFDRPHFHLLIHEKPGEPIVHSRIKHHWKFGHLEAHLVHDERDCFYVAKYVGKEDRLARVRASRSYGMPPQCETLLNNVEENGDPPPTPPEAPSSEATANENKLGETSLEGAWIPYRLNDCRDPDTGEAFIPFFDD